MSQHIHLTPKQLSLVALLIGLALFAFEGYSAAKSFQSASWPTTRGKVTKSELKRSSSYSSKSRRRTTTYRPEIEYAYRIDGKEYTSRRIKFGGINFGLSGLLSGVNRGTVDKYSKGRPVTVHYNAKAPSQAVLETKLPISAYAILGIATMLCTASLIPMLHKEIAANELQTPEMAKI